MGIPRTTTGYPQWRPPIPMVPLMVSSLWTGAATRKDAARQYSTGEYSRWCRRAALAACDANDGVDGWYHHESSGLPLGPGGDARVQGGRCGGLSQQERKGPRCAPSMRVRRNPRTGKQIFPGFSVGSEAQKSLPTTGMEPFPVATSFLPRSVFNDQSSNFLQFRLRSTMSIGRWLYGSNAIDVPLHGARGVFSPAIASCCFHMAGPMG